MNTLEITTFSTKEFLESAIDKFSLEEVLSFLVDICHEKAEHIECNWQDLESAKVWDNAAKEIDKATDKITKNWLS